MPNGGPSSTRRPATAPTTGTAPHVRLRPAAAAPSVARPAAAPAAPGAAAVANLPAWVSVATGGLRRDGLPAVEEVLGRRILVPHPDTGLPTCALLDLHVVDRTSGTWYRAAISGGAGAAVGTPPQWQYIQARWEPTARPLF